MKRISFSIFTLFLFSLCTLAQSEKPTPLTLAAPGTYNDSSELAVPGEELIYYFSYAIDDYNGGYVYLHLITDEVDSRYFPSDGDYEINLSGAPKSILAGYRTDLYYGSYIVPVVNGNSRGICFLDSGSIAVAGNADNCTISMHFRASDNNLYNLQYNGPIQTFHHDTIPYMNESAVASIDFTADNCEIYQFPEYDEFDVYLDDLTNNLSIHILGNIPDNGNIYTTMNVSQVDDDETLGVILRSKGFLNGTLYPTFLASFSGDRYTTDSLYFIVDGSLTLTQNNDGTTSVVGTLISFYGSEIRINYRGNINTPTENITKTSLKIHTEGNILYIDEEQAGDYSLFDSAGRLVYQSNQKSITITVPGIYIVKFRDFAEKVVIR